MGQFCRKLQSPKNLHLYLAVSNQLVITNAVRSLKYPSSWEVKYLQDLNLRSSRCARSMHGRIHLICQIRNFFHCILSIKIYLRFPYKLIGRDRTTNYEIYCESIVSNRQSTTKYVCVIQGGKPVAYYVARQH